MQINTISLNEEARLQELYSYTILDTAPEQEFDDLVALASQIYGCPIAAITFVDKNRQWFKAIKGIGVSETDRKIAFCSHTILQNEIMIVKDATVDSRFSANPLVTNDPSIRFYAGVPIVTGNGHNIGSLCIIDQKTRSLSAEQLEGLEIISRQVSKLLELRLKNTLLQAHSDMKIKKQKEIIQKTMLVQEEENFYVSTELHENIAQGLAATKLYLDMASAGANLHYLKKCRENVSKMIDQTRSLSQKIFPTTLKNAPLTELIQPLFVQFKKETACTLEHSFIATKQIPAEYFTIIFRIVQEQLKNILQHAMASHVKIRLEAGEKIHLLIEDNGIGINIPNFKKGYGIDKIVLLAEFFNGKVEIESYHNTGCRLQVLIPLAAPITNEAHKKQGSMIPKPV
jgi:signal transduction histidine kinase